MCEDGCAFRSFILLFILPFFHPKKVNAICGAMCLLFFYTKIAVSYVYLYDGDFFFNSSENFKGVKNLQDYNPVSLCC